MTLTETKSRPSRQSRRRSPAIDLHQLDEVQIWQLAEELNGAPVPGVRMTESEFERWSDEDTRAEWVDGEIILMAPANDEHDEINVWLVRLLGNLIEDQESGLVRANVSVRLPGQHRRRGPDLFFVAKGRENLMRETFFDGAPDLVVEIVSPDSQSRDRREKFREYEKAGVREYWIVDALSKTVEFYYLERKRFHLVNEENGLLTSTVIRGLRIKPAELWKKPLPKVSTILRRLASGK